MNEPRRTANVLFVGLKAGTFERAKSLVKSSFQGMHMGWSFIPNHADFATAPQQAAAWRDLDVVHIENERDLPYSEYMAEISALAAILHDHSNKPWVNLSPDLEYLAFMFERLVVHVEVGGIEAVCLERWAERCKLAKVGA